MFYLRIAFPSVDRPDRVIIFEWPFKHSVHELTWDGFLGRLCDQAKMKKGKFYVSWHDGEEYCTITSTESLQEAIVGMLRSNPNKPPILFASPVTSDEDNHRLSGFFHNCVPEDLPKDFRECAMRLEEGIETDYTMQDSTSPFPRICAGCNLTEWKGDKYACVVCPAVVYCADCYKREGHSDHPMLITREHSIFPSPLLKAVKSVASTINVIDSSDDDSRPSSTEIGQQSTPAAVSPNNLWAVPATIDPKVSAAIDQLRAMGFTNDFVELYRLAAAEKGDVTSIVEHLTS